MRRTFPLLALVLALSAWAVSASSQSLPSEGAKSGSIFSGGGSTPEPYRSPASPPAGTDRRTESPSLDPRQGPGSSPSPGNSLGDTVQKQNDETKRQREMIKLR